MIILLEVADHSIFNFLINNVKQFHRPQFGFGASLGGWPSSSTTATPTNFGNLNTTTNKPTTNMPFSSFGGTPTSSVTFGATTTVPTTTTKSGNFCIAYLIVRKENKKI